MPTCTAAVDLDSDFVPLINTGTSYLKATFAAVALAVDEQSEVIDFGRPVGALVLTLDVTAISGTDETLDVDVQHSPDNSTWSVLGSFTQVTVAGDETKIFGPAHRYVRLDLDIGGTSSPQATFTVAGPTSGSTL